MNEKGKEGMCEERKGLRASDLDTPGLSVTFLTLSPLTSKLGTRSCLTGLLERLPETMLVKILAQGLAHYKHSGKASRHYDYSNDSNWG